MVIIWFDLFLSDSKIVDPFSQSYHKIQIYEWSIIDNASTYRIYCIFKTIQSLCSLKWLNSSPKRVSSFIHCVKSVRIRSYSGAHFSRIFPHSDWIRRDIQSECRYFSVFSPNVRKCGKNADQNNSEYGYFLRSDAEWIMNWK